MSATVERLYEKYFRMTNDAQAAALLVTAAVNLGEDVEEKLLTTREAAKRMNVCEEYIRRLCRSGKLQSIKSGNGFRFKPEWIDNHISSTTDISLN